MQRTKEEKQKFYIVLKCTLIWLFVMYTGTTHRVCRLYGMNKMSHFYIPSFYNSRSNQIYTTFYISHHNIT